MNYFLLKLKKFMRKILLIYGVPKIHVILNREGYSVSLKLVQRIMKTLGISSITRKKYKPQTIKSAVEAPANNLLKQDFTKVKDLGATLTYSRKGNPYDNAPIESFHSILKKELIYPSKPKTFEETKKSLFKYIESWYNNHRVQKKLGYLSPVDYKKQVA